MWRRELPEEDLLILKCCEHCKVDGGFGARGQRWIQVRRDQARVWINALNVSELCGAETVSRNDVEQVNRAYS